ncbi:hypothetical protein AB0K34_04995 [Actinomadura sp. NPDC049382]|uniref:hypothetical protein n=1 Tax=Actinomadura sp. NPDC049382 TaxID=3158220 RepID=UPI00344661B0
MTAQICQGGWARTPCRNEAAHQAKAGCEHEHVVDVALCDECLGRLNDRMYCCHACVTEHDHVCMLLGRVEAPA